MTLEKSSTVLWQWPSLRLLDNTTESKSCTEPSERRPRPFSPHKYHPKHLQYTHAQPCVQTPSSSRQKQWLPPAGRCWIAQDSLPACTWLFLPAGIQATRGCCSLADHTHTSSWKYEIPHCSTFLYHYRFSWDPYLRTPIPVSFSKNPPFPSAFPKHHFSSSCPSGYRNPQNLTDKAVLSFHPFSKHNTSFFCSTEKVRFLLHSLSS